MAAKKTAGSSGAKKQSPSSSIDRRLGALPAGSADTAPTTPVVESLLEARQVALAAFKDRNLMAKLPGFEVRDIDDLRPLADALEVAEDAWRDQRLSKKGGGQGKSRAEAESLKTELMRSARYLLRKDPEMLVRLNDIAAGDGLPDLIDDLGRLAKLVGEHAALFAADSGLPKNPAGVARSLAETLTNGVDSSAANAAQARRNLLAHAVDDAVHEIRAAAHFLFHGEPKKLAPYLSRYGNARKHRSRIVAKKPAATPA